MTFTQVKIIPLSITLMGPLFQEEENSVLELKTEMLHMQLVRQENT